ncbi:MAG: GTPase Era [Acetivibrionales bacterium]|jgi:GTP-binding protein Era
MPFKSGFVAIAGRPNVGKSTLVNSISGEKISIISHKPQTTRNTIRTIYTRDDCQIVFIDTPGMHKPKNKLGEYMVNIARRTLQEVDLVLFIIEATDIAPGKGDMFIIEQLKSVTTPVFLIINKIDLVKKEQILPLVSAYTEKGNFKTVIPLSAINGEGIDILIDEIKKTLPEGPLYFPEDMVTDQPERMIVSEIIREKTLNLLDEEVPHGVGVEVISFKEREDKRIIDIQANIYCERDSHKGIIIGKQGKMLKRIGSQSREEIENLLGSKVFLEIWVKVKEDWRNSNTMLRTLGYQ